MGLDVHGLKFLLAAKSNGVCFAKTAMIGRQGLDLDWISLRKALRAFGFNITDGKTKHLLTETDGYAEPFLQLLGAEEICSIDASSYEGASITHDLNVPISDTLKNRFTVVLDSGTLEHVFNFPRAIQNCMEMLEVGGHFIGYTPANNFMGHGFYQFSPELYFRVFSKCNGFVVERMLLLEWPFPKKWYEVLDPDVIHKRVELINKHPTYLLIQAKKIAAVPVFSSVPQQSDYEALWDGMPESNVVSGRRRRRQEMLRQAKSRLPRRLVNAARNVKRLLQIRSRRKLNPEFFREVTL